MDKDIKSEQHSFGEIVSLALSAELCTHASEIPIGCLMKLSPSMIHTIEGASENLTTGSFAKNVFSGGVLSGDFMLGVANDSNNQRCPYLLNFRCETNGPNKGDYAYDLYILSSFALGDEVTQCRHLASDCRSGISRYLQQSKFITGRNAMPNNVYVEISSMDNCTYTSDFKQFMDSAMRTAESKIGGYH